MSEIRIMAFNFAPKGWALCNGQQMQINQNQALFALLGTTFGGDGRVTFGLPNLQGCIPMHIGQGHTLGEIAGEASHTLTISEMPQHLHTLSGSTQAVNQILPVGNAPGQSAPNNLYTGPQSLVAMNPKSVSNVGGSQPHENRQPYLTLSFCIALVGVFPSRN
jgi:microcystin-dependent protein